MLPVSLKLSIPGKLHFKLGLYIVLNPKEKLFVSGEVSPRPPRNSGCLWYSVFIRS